MGISFGQRLRLTRYIQTLDIFEDTTKTVCFIQGHQSQEITYAIEEVSADQDAIALDGSEPDVEENVDSEQFLTTQPSTSTKLAEKVRL